jgi:DnaJ-class molecular chaperone
MANFIFVGGYIRRIGERKPRFFTVECAYSKGKGNDPNGDPITADCPACKGTGWITLKGKPEDYKRCGKCNGCGQDPDDFVSYHPCHICKGSGLVSIKE